MARNYEANPKHKTQTIGIASPMNLSVTQAQALLNSAQAYKFSNEVYIGVRGKEIYAFRMHLPNTYHGYHITGNEVCRSFSRVQNDVAKALGVNVKRLSRMR